jgi:hypothetical protein
MPRGVSVKDGAARAVCAGGVHVAAEAEAGPAQAADSATASGTSRSVFRSIGRVVPVPTVRKRRPAPGPLTGNLRSVAGSALRRRGVWTGHLAQAAVLGADFPVIDVNSSAPRARRAAP